MRIVIDLQSLQKPSQRIELRAYMLSFIKFSLRCSSDHEIFVTLTDLYPESIKAIRAELHGFISQHRIRIFSIPGHLPRGSFAKAWWQTVAELSWEAFLVSLEPDIVYLTDFFNDIYGDVITSIKNFTQEFCVVILFWNSQALNDRLRPSVMNNKHNLKIKQFCQADLYHIVHFSFAKELENLLAIAPEKIYKSQHTGNDAFSLDFIEIEAHALWDKFVSLNRLYKKIVNRTQSIEEALLKRIVNIDFYAPTDKQCFFVAKALSESIVPQNYTPQLLIDISSVAKKDAKTGVQRVVRALLIELIKSPPEGYRVEAVYFSDDGQCRYARRKTFEFFNSDNITCIDEFVETQPGDIFLGLDLSWNVTIKNQLLLDRWHFRGVGIYYVMYDLLPISMPSKVPPALTIMQEAWLQVILQFNGVLCISKAVAEEFSAWRAQKEIKFSGPYAIEWFHLGADIQASAPTLGLPENATQVLEDLSVHSTFLMVGTIERRKGYLQVMLAFEKLWQENVCVNLVFIGKPGWDCQDILVKIRNQQKTNKHFFFLENVSDEYLEKIYGASHCLIAASEGEGFGLPLIEAAKNSLAIIARDIPVFREVAGEHALYFKGTEALDIANVVQHWLALRSNHQEPASQGLRWLTWQESAVQLKQKLMQTYQNS